MPSPPLTLSNATALVVASMIGTGIFTTTGLVLGTLGSPPVVLAVWAVSGLLALSGAAVYAELGAMMPYAGGEYVYVSRALHPMAGFLMGWVSVLVGFSAPIAASALAFARYLATSFPGVPTKPTAIALIAAATALHARNVRRGGAAQTVMTALTVALILAFVVGALLSGQTDLARLVPATGAETWPSGGAVAVSLVYVGYSYCGWSAAAYVAGELRDPGRTLPRALLGGAALVTVLYLALNLVFLTAVPVDALAGRIEAADVAARALFGARGGRALSALVTLVLAGSVSALLMTGARVLQAMAADGFFFAAMARTTPAGAPIVAVLFLGGLAAAGAASASFEPLLVYAGFTLTLGGAATVAAAFVLRWRAPDMPRPYRAMAWPFSGLAYLGLALFVSAFAVRERPVESLAGLATLLAGGVAATIWQRHSHRRS